MFFILDFKKYRNMGELNIVFNIIKEVFFWQKFFYDWKNLYDSKYKFCILN